MVFAWIARNKLRKEDKALPIQATYQALLSSLIADGDVASDWIYYIEIIKRSGGDNYIPPQWLINIQLVSCIFGTISWLAVASDGRIIDWFRYIIFGIPSLLLYIPYVINVLICPTCLPDCIDCTDWIGGAAASLKKLAVRKTSFSSATLLLLGILMEDTPQLVVTFLIEGKSGSNISVAAIFNLILAVFDILHKIAEALDLRSDVLNVEYAVKCKMRGHDSGNMSLEAIPGTNQFLSVSSGYMKLWNAESGKLVRSFKNRGSVDLSHLQRENLNLTEDLKEALKGNYLIVSEKNVAVLGTSKVIKGHRRRICLYDLISTGEEPFKTLDIDAPVHSVAVSPDESYFLTASKMSIQMWDANSYNLIRTYNKEASVAIAIIDNDSFLSVHYKSNNVLVWNTADGDAPSHTLTYTNTESLTRDKTNVTSVMVMNSSLFLTGHEKGAIKTRFISSTDGKWQHSHTSLKGQDSSSILTLTKVNDNLFVSTSYDKTAKLWDIEKNECVFTFKGHSSRVITAVFLSKERAVATGDERGYIKIWSIDEFLGKENNNEDPAESNSVDIA